MEELIEILDGAGIDSSRISCWCDESLAFISWYVGLRCKTDNIFEFEMHLKSIDPKELLKACLKLETKMDVPFCNKARK